MTSNYNICIRVADTTFYATGITLESGATFASGYIVEIIPQVGPRLSPKTRVLSPRHLKIFCRSISPVLPLQCLQLYG